MATDSEIGRELAQRALSSPFDPEAMLIYSDWLEENGYVDQAASWREIAAAKDDALAVAFFNTVVELQADKRADFFRIFEQLRQPASASSGPL